MPELVLRRNAHIFEHAAFPTALRKAVNRCCEWVASHRIQIFLTLVVHLACYAPRLLIGVILLHNLLIHLLVQLFEHEVVLRVFVVHEFFQALRHLVLLNSAITCDHSFPPVPACCTLDCFLWHRVRLLMKHEIRAWDLAKTGSVILMIGWRIVGSVCRDISQRSFLGMNVGDNHTQFWFFGRWCLLMQWNEMLALSRWMIILHSWR